MKFPSIGEIATTDVVSINIDNSITNAIEVMLKHNHRNVIVTSANDFFLFSVLDILNVQSLGLNLNTSLQELELYKIPTIEKQKNILEALEFLNEKMEYICVINKDRTLYGLVTHTDITSSIDPETLMDNLCLEDFLKNGRRVKWVNKEENISDLLNQMSSNTFDNLIVVEDARPIGIITTKDVMNLIKSKSDFTLKVSHYMSAPVDTINKKSSIKEALNYIQEKQYKRVIVVDDDGKLTGIISQKELISMSYSRWAIIMKEYQSELHEINSMLKSKNKEYEIMASTDSLTGLYNRHKFTELYLSSYTSMIQRDNEMSLILLDIDHFKRVNDTYGHGVGDTVLVQIAHTLLRTLRNIDIVCRWGGEEFLVLLPTASIDNAKALAQKLKENIETLEIEIAGSVTASFGISNVKEGESMHEVVDRADKALYLAKNSGRNCVKTELDL